MTDGAVQLNLDGGFAATPAGRTLTPRQQLALAHIASRQPVATDELGAVLHEHRRATGGKGHGRDERCDFCTSEGRQMGEALRRRVLVRYRRGAGWTLPDYRPGDHLPSSQNATGPDGFPEGF